MLPRRELGGSVVGGQGISAWLQPSVGSRQLTRAADARHGGSSLYGSCTGNGTLHQIQICRTSTLVSPVCRVP